MVEYSISLRRPPVQQLKPRRSHLGSNGFYVRRALINGGRVLQLLDGTDVIIAVRSQTWLVVDELSWKFRQTIDGSTAAAVMTTDMQMSRYESDDMLQWWLRCNVFEFSLSQRHLWCVNAQHPAIETHARTHNHNMRAKRAIPWIKTGLVDRHLVLFI